MHGSKVKGQADAAVGIKVARASKPRPLFSPNPTLHDVSLPTMSTPTSTVVNGFEALSLADSYEVVELAASPVEDQSNAAGSSSSPNSDTMAADEGKELLITTTPHHIELQRIILPLRGECPEDLPLDPTLTRGIMDRRMLDSYTVRYRSTDSPSPIATLVGCDGAGRGSTPEKRKGALCSKSRRGRPRSPVLATGCRLLFSTTDYRGSCCSQQQSKRSEDQHSS